MDLAVTLDQHVITLEQLVNEWELPESTILPAFEQLEANCNVWA